MKPMPLTRLVKVGIAAVFLATLFLVASAAYFLFRDGSHFPYLVLLLALAVLVSALAAEFFHSRPYSFVIGLTLFSLVSSLLIVLWSRTEPVSDFAVLYSLSGALKNGDFATLRSTPYFLQWAYQSFFVMYQALIVALFPGGILPLTIMNVFFRTGILLLIYFIALEVFERRTAVWATVLYLFYPAPYFLLSVLTNQHISLFFLLLGFYVFLKADRISGKITGGLLIGLGNALRPDGQLLLFALMAFGLVTALSEKRKNARAFLLPLVPPAAAVFSSLLLGFAISILVVMLGVNPNGQTNSDPLWRLVAGLNQSSAGEYSVELEQEVFSVSDIAERHQIEREIIARHLSTDKKDLLVFLAKKTMIFWGQLERPDFAFGNQYDRNTPIINKPLGSVLTVLAAFDRLFFGFVAVACLLSCAVLFRVKETSAALMLCGMMILIFFGAYLFIEVQPRYKYLIYPFFFILSGTGFEWLYHAIRPGKNAPLPYSPS